jgi:hypothetical protein
MEKANVLKGTNLGLLICALYCKLAPFEIRIWVLTVRSERKWDTRYQRRTTYIEQTNAGHEIRRLLYFSAAVRTLTSLTGLGRPRSTIHLLHHID